MPTILNNIVTINRTYLVNISVLDKTVLSVIIALQIDQFRHSHTFMSFKLYNLSKDF